MTKRTTGRRMLLVPRQEETLATPEQLGPMMDAREVAALVYEGKVSPRWVVQHHDPLRRHKWGRTCYWYRNEAVQWKREQELKRARALGQAGDA